MLGTTLGLGGVRLLLGNRITRVMSQISYQMYLWHQVLAVQLRTWGIPASAHALPNQVGDRVWQRSYVLLCYMGALVISALVTYLIEQPIARRFSGRVRTKTRRHPHEGSTHTKIGANFGALLLQRAVWRAYFGGGQGLGAGVRRCHH